jgi:hypothetical protein
MRGPSLSHEFERIVEPETRVIFTVVSIARILGRAVTDGLGERMPDGYTPPHTMLEQSKAQRSA